MERWEAVAAMAQEVEDSVDAMHENADAYIAHLEHRWNRLKKKVASEQRRYEDKGGLNIKQQAIAAALESAYGSVVRMMDREEDATKRDP